MDSSRHDSFYRQAGRNASSAGGEAGFAAGSGPVFRTGMVEKRTFQTATRRIRIGCAFSEKVLPPENPRDQLAKLRPLALHENADSKNASRGVDTQSGGRQHHDDSGHRLPPGNAGRDRLPGDHQHGRGRRKER